MCHPSSSALFAETLSTIKLSQQLLQPEGIAATPSGVLIVACRLTHSVYAIDPFTGHCERIAGTGKDGELKDGPALKAVLSYPCGVVVVDGECTALVCSQAIRRIELLPSLFQTRTFCACVRSLLLI